MEKSLRIREKGKAIQRLRDLVKERDILHGLHHPNIVRYLKYFEKSETVGDASVMRNAYLYTEYCEGGDLSKYSKDEDVGEEAEEPEDAEWLQPHQIWALTYDLAAALALCHHGLARNGFGSFSLKHQWKPILHRDIKPANGRRYLRRCKLPLNESSCDEHQRRRNRGREAL